MTNLRLRNLMLPVALAVLAAVLVGFYVILAVLTFFE